MSTGYVQDRGHGGGGPCYEWTRKEKGKMVSLPLATEKCEAMMEAIEEWREVGGDPSSEAVTQESLVLWKLVG
jgi:hypothetical protein